MTSSPWKLDRLAASLHAGELSGLLDLGRLDRGIQSLRLGAVTCSGLRPFQLRLASADPTAPPPRDHYVRGRDLIASYQSAVDQTLPTICWRAADTAEPTLDLAISMQTEAIQCSAGCVSTTLVEADQVWRLADVGHGQFEQILPTGDQQLRLEPARGAGLLLFRLPGVSISYAEMIAPADFCGSRLLFVDDGRNVELTTELFPEPLEKGVIRRVQLRGLILPQQSDQRLALSAYRQFVQADPVLTA